MSDLFSDKSLESLSINELEQLVQHHNERYWILNEPEISDVDYDRLIEALRRKSPDNPLLSEIGSYSEKGGVLGEELGRGDKIVHLRPMLSLGKCYDKETLEKWFDKFEGGVVATPKIDGVAVSILYSVEGRLLYASTRGDGREGEIITSNAQQIVDLPQSINNLRELLDLEYDTIDPNQPFLEVRGEAYMPISIFTTEFQHEFKSPRNLTAGALKQKESTKTLAYKIHFFAYDILLPDNIPPIETEVRKFDILHQLGFSHVPVIEARVDDLAAAFNEIRSQRLTYDFELDGVVYKANLTRVQRELGVTAHHPRYAIAYKFQGDFGDSYLREVHWSVSRRGTINPVAIIDPVSLSGAVVTRCSLHNLAIMESLAANSDHLCLNSKVLVSRRGGVIPHVEEVLETGDIPIEIPSTCPACGAPTYRESDLLMAHHTPDCATTQIRRIEYFANTMNIKGFGPKLVARLYDEELLSQPSDFYSITKEDLVLLDRVGSKLADRLIDSVQGSLGAPFNLFLRALGIEELGRHVSTILAERIHSLDELFALTEVELAEIHTIGDIIAQKVIAGIDARRDEIIELANLVKPTFIAGAGERAVATREKDGDLPLSGKSFLFTGTLESMKRKEAQDKVVELGGSTPSGVSKDLTYLVLGDGDYEKFEGGWRSSKLKKVEANNANRPEEDHTQIISETKFLELIHENPS